MKITELSSENTLPELIRTRDYAGITKFVEENSISDIQSDILIGHLNQVLALPSEKWDWLTTSSIEEFPALSLATFLIGKVQEKPQFDLLVLVSQYLNPHVPWSNPKLAAEAGNLPENISKWAMDFVDYLKPQLLKLSNLKLSLAGYRRNKKNGLRPALGFSAIGSGLEDDLRAGWKKSEMTKSLSLVCFLIRIGEKSSEFGTFWPLITSFMLNVLDDPDPVFRSQGCFLLLYFLDHGHGHLLQKSGLAQVFQESAETCLSYLPSLTPADVSLHLLRAAYPVLYRLVLVSEYLPFVEIEEQILSSITHVQGRDNDKETNAVLVFLVDQIHHIIQKYLGSAVLVTLSRTMFIVNQLVTNPYIIETENGVELVNSALLVHRSVLELFPDNAEGAKLVMLYKFDFLGSWAVLGKRVEKFGVGNTATGNLIEENCQLLGGLAKLLGSLEELKSDVAEVCLRNPELRFMQLIESL